MASEKVTTTHLQCDRTVYMYYVDAAGNVARKLKKGGGEAEVLIAKAVVRLPGYLYFIDGQGDVSRTLMGKKKAAV